MYVVDAGSARGVAGWKTEDGGDDEWAPIERWLSFREGKENSAQSGSRQMVRVIDSSR